MATDASKLKTPVLSEENSEMLTEKTEKGTQQDPEAAEDEAGDSCVTLDAPPNVEEADAVCVPDGEEGDAKPAAEEEEAVAVGAVAAAVAGVTVAATRDVNDNVVVGCQLAKSEEDSPVPEQTSPADDVDTSGNVFDDTVKKMEIKPEEESSCVKGKATSEDAPESTEEKTNTGGGGLAVGDKRRASVEISSSDGEPLSRMDSEDSISSTLMDMESTVSSGRSTPAMMNGQGSAAQCHSSTKGQAVGYTCCWDQCGLCFTCSPDLAEHIRGVHVDGQRGGVFVCLWKGCKVYNTPSTSQSWLQRHMLTHSGDKPFKCVVGGCNASFASQGGLARHVPTHFSQQSSSKLSSQGRLKEESPSKAGLNKRKKRILMNKRRRSLLSPLPPARPHDFFDAQTMDAIRHRAICLNLATHMESTGNGHSVVFHSTVIARRKEGSGKVKVLLHWTPEDILPDVWVNETERSQLKTKVVHLSQLPQDTAMLLDPNIYRALPQKQLKRR
uniref:Zinc finger protein AEBP2 n=1 Tax=Hucho hucho TaxID=62062 RepID=A0A4W5JGT7_9TELE